MTIMKITRVESGKASGIMGAVDAKILPKDRPRGLVSSRTRKGEATVAAGTGNGRG